MPARLSFSFAIRRVCTVRTACAGRSGEAQERESLRKPGKPGGRRRNPRDDLGFRRGAESRAGTHRPSKDSQVSQGRTGRARTRRSGEDAQVSQGRTGRARTRRPGKDAQAGQGRSGHRTKNKGGAAVFRDRQPAVPVQNKRQRTVGPSRGSSSPARTERRQAQREGIFPCGRGSRAGPLLFFFGGAGPFPRQKRAGANRFAPALPDVSGCALMPPYSPPEPLPP